MEYDKNINKLENIFYYNVVVATDLVGGFGSKGALPWNIPSELKHFKFVTSLAPQGKKNLVVMGRKTWDSIPQKYRPLPERINVVFTQNEEFIRINPNIKNEFYAVRNFEEFEQLLSLEEIKYIIHEIVNIGGKELLTSFSNRKTQICKFIFHSVILKEYPNCDVFWSVPGYFSKEYISSDFYDENEQTSYNYQILVNKEIPEKIKNTIDLYYLNQYFGH